MPPYRDGQLKSAPRAGAKISAAARAVQDQLEVGGIAEIFLISFPLYILSDMRASHAALLSLLEQLLLADGAVVFF